jgi:L-threonylcarbamoyladenylate synthase
MPGKGSRVIPQDDPRATLRASEVLRAGGFVVAPTDTIYGILADALNFSAVRRLYELRRPSGRPFIVLVPDLAWVRKLGLALDRRALGLIARPYLTVVLRKRIKLFPWIGRESVAVRVPARGFVRRLLEVLSRPVVAPSANPEGEPPARTVEEAVGYFSDRVDLYVDGGRVGGQPSALLDLRERPRVLRRGPYTEEALLRILRSPLPCRG